MDAVEDSGAVREHCLQIMIRSTAAFDDASALLENCPMPVDSSASCSDNIEDYITIRNVGARKMTDLDELRKATLLA
ncbi:hypothetical protein, partial [Bradyrhizobium sp. 17]|uniref:hypothetical protein n=1 Tax=Bradyrhizobium sp. 17 TaxID=2782649 RepID=UPI001FF9BD1D